MPTWSEIQAELSTLIQAGNPMPFDQVRRKYLVKLSDHTKRNTILYATNFTAAQPNTPQSALMICDEDVQGLMEVVYSLAPKSDLDLILHSPGGYPDAAESILMYLRSKFRNIRVIVPHLAQSAATMLACGADTIVMGKHSFLGPIDPQLFGVPAQAILDQFDYAVEQCSADPRKLPAWAPILAQYGTSLLKICENSQKLAQGLAESWLRKYLLKGNPKRAARVAAWLANHKEHKSHGRHFSRQHLVRRGIPVLALEKDPVLQDLVLSVFHATTHTFGTGAAKIIENHKGRAFIKIIISQPSFFPGQPQPPQPPTQPQQPAGPNILPPRKPQA